MRKNNPDPRRIPKTDKKKPLKLLKTKVRDKNQESGQSSRTPSKSGSGFPTPREGVRATSCLSSVSWRQQVTPRLILSECISGTRAK